VVNPEQAQQQPGADIDQRVAGLEAELAVERVRRRALLTVLAGMGVLEASRFIAPFTHPAVAVFGAVFCLVYVVYGLYLYSTQERFARKGPASVSGRSDSQG
jgi:hypothetical protein